MVFIFPPGKWAFLLRRLFERRAEKTRERMSEEGIDGAWSEMGGEAAGRKRCEVR